MADENNKCGHEACMCAVGNDDKYCSPVCEAAGEEDVTEIVGSELCIAAGEAKCVAVGCARSADQHQ